MWKDLKIKFSTRKQLVKDHILSLLAETMEYYALPTLVNYTIVNVTFDLWTNRTRIDTFSLVINFIDDVWVPRHVTIGLFEAFNSTRAHLCKNCEAFFDRVSTYREGNIICWRWKIQLEYPCHNIVYSSIMCSIATCKSFCKLVL
jgi:hypothetical protein